MTRRRTRPTQQARTYGVLVGKAVKGKADQGRSPHYEILVSANGDYRIAVNVQSVDGSDVIATFATNYAPPPSLDIAGLASGPAGFRSLTTGAAGKGLDYVRDPGLVDLQAMVPVPAEGPGTSLAPLFDAAIRQAAADPDATIVAFGQAFTDAGADSTFGFSPERGVHDIHMMQGNPASGSFADDNVVHGDGALFIRYGSGAVTAFFSRFSTQAVSTDPVTGAPA
jgi:uncharacterized protein YukJ